MQNANQIADIATVITASAIITRNLIQWLKIKKWAETRNEVMVLSYGINFILITAIEAAQAFLYGVPITVPFMKALAALVISSLYHDWNTKPSQTLVIQPNMPVPPPPVANEAPVATPPTAGTTTP